LPSAVVDGVDELFFSQNNSASDKSEGRCGELFYQVKSVMIPDHGK
jgi:hypothetical protein